MIGDASQRDQARRWAATSILAAVSMALRADLNGSGRRQSRTVEVVHEPGELDQEDTRVREALRAERAEFTLNSKESPFRWPT